MKDAPRGLSKRSAAPVADPEFIAVQALTFMTDDADRASRFFAESGFSPADLRKAAADPQFLGGVLDVLMADEPLLLAFAAGCGHAPEAVVQAHERLVRR